ncbi:MAG: type II toxin-antitoxin system VapC family toxin [Myxococcaceae bacterium]
MKTFVLDTSALLRLYLPDGPLASLSEDALELANQGDAIVSAPELILAEVAQVLLKKERAKLITPEDASRIQKEIFALPIELVKHKEIIELAGELARTHHLSIYDGLFLALARKLRCTLITCDDKLFKASKS